MLTPIECRVLGVLIEKAQTTPGQYPLTLNGAITGCNQKNNRAPVTSYDEDDVLMALDGLRAKGFVREAMMSGSRVAKFRHVTRETLEVDTAQLVVLAELLLRGPQTLGEIRGRATRMHELESIEVVQSILDSLMQRDPPLVRSAPPAAGSRAGRFAQMLCPDLHRIDAAPAAPAPASAPAATTPAAPGLAERVTALEREITELKQVVTVLLEQQNG